MDTSSFINLLNHPLATIAIVLLSAQLLRFFDLSNPKAILMIRFAYLVTQMAMLAFWTWMRGVVQRSKQSGETLEYEEPAKPFSPEPPRKVKITVAEYDGLEIGKQMQQTIVGTIIMLLLHYFFGLVQPLFLQLILPWKGLITNPLVLIHLLGMPARGALKRPFKQPNPLAELMGTQVAEPDSTATTINANAEGRIEEVKDSGSESEKSSTSGSNDLPVMDKSRIVNRKKGGARRED